MKLITVNGQLPSVMGDGIVASTQTKTVTPTKEGFTVTPDLNKLLESVIVNGDTNLIAANIKKDVTIFGVTGTHEGGGGGTQIYTGTFTPTSITPKLTIPTQNKCSHLLVVANKSNEATDRASYGVVLFYHEDKVYPSGSVIGAKGSSSGSSFTTIVHGDRVTEWNNDSVVTDDNNTGGGCGNFIPTNSYTYFAW